MKKTKKTFNDGDVIFREGGPSDVAYEIVFGTVEIAKIGNNGNVILATLGAGEMFGEMGVLDQGTRSATATAACATSIGHSFIASALRPRAIARERVHLD